MLFEFATATKISFGSGASKDLSKHVIMLGRKPIIITDEALRYLDQFIPELNSNNIYPVTFAVTGEPSIDDIRKGVYLARTSGCDMVISIGGGSVVDSGKAIAAFMTNTNDVIEYLEVIGSGKPIKYPPVPFIAIPTTAGTGAEVTANAVLAAPELKIKVSVRSTLMFPKLALVDPLLTITMPPEITASSGLDALVQLTEAYLSNKVNPITDILCLDGLKRVSRSLIDAYNIPDNLIAREDMSLAGMFSGIALSNAKLGSVHGIAGPLGGLLNIPHGVICANLFLSAFEVNINALLKRKPDSPVLSRVIEIAKILSGRESVKINESISILKDFLSPFSLTSLKEYGLEEKMFPELIEKSKKASSMKGNPIELLDNEIEKILINSIN